MSPGFHIQGEISIYIDWMEDDESLWSKSAEAALRAMQEWCKDEYHLWILAPDEYSINLRATPNEEEETR